MALMCMHAGMSCLQPAAARGGLQALYIVNKSGRVSVHAKEPGSGAKHKHLWQDGRPRPYLLITPECGSDTHSALVTQELWLKDNRLASLPEELGTCAKLKRLWLDDNRLQALPASITRLCALQELYVPHNRLRSLPPGLAKMPALRKLCAPATAAQPGCRLQGCLA